MRADVYERITNLIIADLERGVLPWLKPSTAEHAAGRITRRLRANGIPYRGINILMLWSDAMERGYAARIPSGSPIGDHRFLNKFGHRAVRH